MKTVCLYMEDCTTAFLRPLCEHICSTFNAKKIGYDTSGDDDPLELIYQELRDAQTVFFLGHGMSTCLYASILDNVELINNDNIDLLKGKRLFLLSCNSDQFIRNFKLKNAVGFGFLPTSLDDVRTTSKFHNIHIGNLDKKDVDYYNTSIVNALKNTICPQTLTDTHLFEKQLRFNVSREIVQCLLKKDVTNYRTVADELFYVYKDMYIG